MLLDLSVEKIIPFNHVNNDSWHNIAYLLITNYDQLDQGRNRL